MSSAPTAIVCREVFDENSQPSAEEISEYAQQIGIDPVSESHLLPLARDGLMHALPAPWKAYYDDKLKTHYFYNSETRVTQWDHPLDRLYKSLVVKAKLSSERGDSILEDTCVSVQDLLTFEEDGDQISADRCDPKDEMSRDGDSSIATSPDEEASGRDFDLRTDGARHSGASLPSGKGVTVPVERRPSPALKSLAAGARCDSGRGRTGVSPKASRIEVSGSPAVSALRLGFRGGSPQAEDSESDGGVGKNKMRPSDCPPSLRRGSSDIIDLSFIPGVRGTETTDSHNREVRPAKRGIVLTGGGSIFLKSNRNIQENKRPDRHGSLGDEPVSNASEAPKGILRERSFCDSVPKPTAEKNEERNNNERPVTDEDKKSVRFNLDRKDANDGGDTSPELTQSDSPSDEPSASPLRRRGSAVFRNGNDNTETEAFGTLAPPMRRNSDNSDSIKFMRSVKLTPLRSDDGERIKNLQRLSNKEIPAVKPEVASRKTEDFSLSSVSSSPTRKLIRPHPGDFIKPALFRKPFEKLSDILKAESPDTDSESDFAAASIDSVNSPAVKTKISINLMESIESEASVGSPDKDAPIFGNIISSGTNPKSINSTTTVEDSGLPSENVTIHIHEKKTVNAISENDSFHETARVEMEKEFGDRLLSLRKRLEEERSKSVDALKKAIEEAKESHRKDMEKAMETLTMEFSDEKKRAIEELREKLSRELEQTKEELSKEHLRQLELFKKDQKDKFDIFSTALRREYEKSSKEAEACHTEDLEREKKNLLAENRITLEKMKNDHESACDELRKDYRSEIELVRSQQAAHLSTLRERMRREREPPPACPPPQRPDAAYERLRCDKRLLEDKYRCLKEKYARLKSEVKISIERRNKRREQSLTTGSETEKSHSHRTAGLVTEKVEPGDATKSESSNRVKRTATIFGDGGDILKRPLEIEEGGFVRIPRVVDGSRSLGESGGPPMNGNLLRVIGKSEAGDRRRGRSPNPEMDDDSVGGSDSRTVSNGKPVRRVQVIDRRDSERRRDYSDAKDSHAGRGNTEQSCVETTVTDYQDSSDTAASERRHLKEAMNGRSRKKLFTRLKSASTSRLNYTVSSKSKERSCSPVENLRRQLRKLEDLEEQFPDVTVDADTTAYRLRYPFPDSGATSGGELGFLRHRALVEREGVRRAKDNLRARAHLLRQRKRDPKAWQDECELTDMEVSLHRTKSVLGEKVIRLRHIEKSLRRIEDGREDDAPSEPAGPRDRSPRDRHHNKERTLSDISSHSSGFSSTEGQSSPPDSRVVATLNTLQSLNAEIRDIWQVLNSQQQMNVAKVFPIGQLLYADAGWRSPIAAGDVLDSGNLADSVRRPPLGFVSPADGRIRPLDRRQPAVCRLSQPLMSGGGGASTGLVERTRDLRDWLKQQAAL